MPRRRTETEQYADEYGDIALDELMDLLGEYPELDEYFDGIDDLDDKYGE